MAGECWCLCARDPSGRVLRSQESPHGLARQVRCHGLHGGKGAPLCISTLCLTCRCATAPEVRAWALQIAAGIRKRPHQRTSNLTQLAMPACPCRCERSSAVAWLWPQHHICTTICMPGAYPAGTVTWTCLPDGACTASTEPGPEPWGTTSWSCSVWGYMTGTTCGYEGAICGWAEALGPIATGVAIGAACIGIWPGTICIIGCIGTIPPP